MRWMASPVVAVLVLLPLTAAPAPAAPRCTAGTAPYQRELERELRLPVDGRQSAADCAAIRRLQLRLGVRPADGFASLRTYRMLLVDIARRDP
ncbi:murein L,D-transpeptidase, partial [Streptomyces sp. T-3]|nr:murein L,D-transpeptidase [Streptomyces sp. T-3]